MNRSDIVVEFPDRINRYRLISNIEADIFMIAAFSAIGFVTLLFFVTSQPGSSFIMGLGIAGGITYLYIYFKEKNKRGFLIHWLYSRGIYRPKYKGVEGLPKYFLTEGWVHEFND
ncbi:hypothetical protein BKH46_08600 [Helicobacter sp. 12S02634-8]|uniref:hypothetical protein n=1 Tax=Helicobacter sp. 12S02634-8 TaxID=1476199 RepID=UPI000BA515ED|nr:hypothetical protein [Helicobacter sp. 12S02634-8]PAF46186.1 hypothetical protein BKH46_08600 [Helicobacter sp. 12S02634-8]